jgi:hypothetical protein
VHHNNLKKYHHGLSDEYNKSATNSISGKEIEPIEPNASSVSIGATNENIQCSTENLQDVDNRTENDIVEHIERDSTTKAKTLAVKTAKKSKASKNRRMRRKKNSKPDSGKESVDDPDFVPLIPLRKFVEEDQTVRKSSRIRKAPDRLEVGVAKK